MREQMVLDEKIIGVELTANKKQFKWPVNDTNEKKSKDNNDDDDNESADEMSALQKIFVVHSVNRLREKKLNNRFMFHRLFLALVLNLINEI